MKAGVLLGGTSVERDVSVLTARSVIKALGELGHEVVAADPAFNTDQFTTGILGDSSAIKNIPPDVSKIPGYGEFYAVDVIKYLKGQRVDFIFNALHGGSGEDGTIQGVMDIMGLKYTGSGLLASALAMDKLSSKRLFESEGIRTPRWRYFSSGGLNGNKGIAEEIVDVFNFPVVIKPRDQGSTVGVSVVQSRDDLESSIAKAFGYSSGIIVEEYISGRELTVALLGDRALPPVEIHPEHGIYDYECKYIKGKSRYTVPASLSPELYDELCHLALMAFNIFNCRAYARADFRVSEDDLPFILELNTLPGMTETSLVPKAAKAKGLSFNELVEKIIELSI